VAWLPIPRNPTGGEVILCDLPGHGDSPDPAQYIIMPVPEHDAVASPLAKLRVPTGKNAPLVEMRGACGRASKPGAGACTC
jgi:hypothetical protein